MSAARLVVTGLAAGGVFALALALGARFLGDGRDAGDRAALDVAPAPAAPPAAVAAPPALAPAQPALLEGAPDAWRASAQPTRDIPAGVLARMASRRPLERGGPCSAEPPARRARALAAADAGAARCEPAVETLEMDWNAKPAVP